VARRAVAPQVQLEPPAAVRRRRGEPLDGRGAHRRQRVRDADACRHPGDRGLTVGVHHPSETGRGEHQGEGRWSAENHRRGVHDGDVLEHLWLELHAGVRLARSAQTDLLTCGAVGVVEHCAGGTTSGQQPQIRDGRDRGEPTLGGPERHFARAEQRLQLGPARPATDSHLRVLHEDARGRVAIYPRALVADCWPGAHRRFSTWAAAGAHWKRLARGA
jgi:hypothetical protein